VQAIENKKAWVQRCAQAFDLSGGGTGILLQSPNYQYFSLRITIAIFRLINAPFLFLPAATMLYPTAQISFPAAPPYQDYRYSLL
jgi:hypothetical protein